MKLHFLFLPICIIVLCTLVLRSAVSIEILNSEAGVYLPRSDRNPDGTFSDGKWRVSRGGDEPRDLLRGEIQSYGLSQYALAPLLLFLSGLALRRGTRSKERILGGLGFGIATAAIVLMEYRGYWSSLG